ncbi:NUDIX hydrolase [Rhodanobacter thiooxydans]|uniref:NUDIX hydrolase n=1 Tax=Rhodanobacter thiooxydans TaxID=416169 RepID=A0A154QDM8_9GAMM|nr:NUDIX domain-containing protein [Rhodanobacter thiooxydans]EIM00707.1 NUDIX domain-containing protein [Rhodanobacter thiooxydans LCS2]KZC22254.1 NUDIX hydrolase [Rhodanobacter thiooxydans]MCW0203484.1 NUDIX domain-containing protein [Rhodanobacter thiooxydans]
MSAERNLPVRSSMVSVVALRGSGAATQMLVARRAGAYLDGAWSYLAGHVEAGETGWQAALRELREETALVPQSFWATSFCEQVYLAATDTVEIVPAFVARLAEGVQVRLNGEHSAFRWVTLDEAAALLPFGSQRELLAHVRREFVEREPSPFLRLAPR